MTAFYNHFEMKSFMTKVKNDFLKEQENWCDIKHFQFSNGFYREYADDDYNKLYMEQYYVLKYFPLYFDEYKHAYEMFFNSYSKSTLKVLSIGVGSGVDYLALKEVMRERNLDTSLDYVGIDRINWKYRDANIIFVNTDILHLKKTYFQDVDLIVFPKSLIELDEERLNHISSYVISAASKEIHFLNTYVKKGDHVSGLNEFNMIHQNLIQTGHKFLDDDAYRSYTFNNASKIEYPIYYNSWKKPLEFYCHGRCGENQSNQCNIVQYPMMNKNNMAFNVLKYTKETK